jgi:hypothetical protein
MAKLIWIIMLSVVINATDIFDQKCVPCHRDLPTSLQQMFMQYLKLYSSEDNVKYILKYYLKNPSKKTSAMSDLFLDVYGIKEPTKLSDEELQKAIDIYWDRYKVIGRLK